MSDRILCLNEIEMNDRSFKTKKTIGISDRITTSNNMENSIDVDDYLTAVKLMRIHCKYV